MHIRLICGLHATRRSSLLVSSHLNSLLSTYHSWFKLYSCCVATQAATTINLIIPLLLLFLLRNNATTAGCLKILLEAKNDDYYSNTGLLGERPVASTDRYQNSSGASGLYLVRHIVKRVLVPGRTKGVLKKL
mmetsp:Transcript_29990/g.48085  ORF Transcript_29990/g.48085 Transcript_29990/m.48085 type:complete len:133 (-) Transcript_29990:816-1214(-)